MHKLHVIGFLQHKVSTPISYLLVVFNVNTISYFVSLFFDFCKNRLDVYSVIPFVQQQQNILLVCNRQLQTFVLTSQAKLLFLVLFYFSF